MRSFLVSSLVLLSGCWTTIEPGTVGVWVESGEITGVYPAGLYGLDPAFSEVIYVDLRVQRVDIVAPASSSDIQTVTTTVALNYTIDPEHVVDLITSIGTLEMVQHRIIEPAFQNAVKAVTANYTAVELVTKRTEVKDAMEAQLREELATSHILVTSVSITNFEFSPAFQAAIEQKQVAEQAAQRAENDLERIRTEADQVAAEAEGRARAALSTARAEAEASALLSAEITDKTLRLRAIEKWNGALPVTMAGDTDLTFLLGTTP